MKMLGSERPKRVAIAVVVLGFLVSIAAATLIMRYRSRSSLEGLVRASASLRHRPFEARLSGGFAYHPFREISRGDASSDDNWQIFPVANVLRREATRHRSASSLHALGVAYLWTGDTSNAVATLDDALRSETEEDDANRAIERSVDPKLLVDIAAARVAPHATQQPYGDLLTALAAADRAVRLAPDDDNALFDRALALQKLGLHADAAAGWRAYLRIDRSSGWAAEAKRNLMVLESPQSAWARESHPLASLGLPEPVLHDSQTARTYVEDDLMPAWARLLSEGQRDAAADRLHVARKIAELLTRITGDRMAEDEVARGTVGADAATLAKGHIAYATAAASFRK